MFQSETDLIFGLDTPMSFSKSSVNDKSVQVWARMAGWLLCSRATVSFICRLVTILLLCVDSSKT